MVVLTLLAALGSAQWPAAYQSTRIADSTPEFRSARNAQEAFEWSRVRLLPIGGGSSGRCDERIGRFCYWYDDGDTTLPMEPAALVQARERLLGELDRARRARPDNDWIVGQHVRYLVEHGRAAEAVTAAEECGGTAWWCLALRGFSLHAAQRFADADSAFAQASREMPRDVFCQWTDWTRILEPPLESRYRSLDCDQRARLADTVLELSQPLLSLPGNDFRTELLSRRVTSMLIAAARSPQPWSRDLDELGLRYGWPIRWTLTDDSRPTLEVPSVIGHDRSPAYAFIPVSVTDSGAAPWRWELEPDHPRSRYGPTYLGRFGPIGGFQIARFPRGDSTIVVGAVAPASDTLFARRPLHLGLALLADLSRPVVVRRDSAPGVAALFAAVSGAPFVVSAEAWNSKTRRAIRARIAFRPPDTTAALRLSDPLLFAPGEALPETLEAAAARALTSTTFPRRSPVGIYWEAGGIGADSVDVSIKVIATRRGLAGRIAQGLSLVGRRSPLTLRWSSPAGTPPRGDVVGRAFELDLRRLKPGRYQLVLEARTPAGDSAATALPIELRP
jgi:hypothetical protein